MSIDLGAFLLACAPPKTVGDLGTTPSLGPEVTVREEWKQPPTITVALSQPAYLTLFLVTPNHKVELMTLAGPDSLFGTGAHVLRATAPATPPQTGAAFAGGTYPDLGAPCAVTDFVKETTQLSTGPGGTEQKTDVITFATPSTSPPIVTCSVPGFQQVAPASPPALDRYLLVVATEKAVTPDAIVESLAGLDASGTPREVSERVASLTARTAGSTQWGARAIRF